MAGIYCRGCGEFYSHFEHSECPHCGEETPEFKRAWASPNNSSGEPGSRS